MARPRTGSAFVHGDHWDTRITLSDGSRGVPVCHHDLPWTGSDPKKRETCPNYSKAKARAVARTQKAEQVGASRKPEADRTKPRTIADLVAKWAPYIEADAEIAPSTRKSHAYHANGPILAAFGTTPIEKLGKAQLRTWLRTMKATRSASRVRNIFFSLARMLDDADAEEWTRDLPNPCRLPAVRDLLPGLEWDADGEGKAHIAADDIRTQIAATPDAWRRVQYVVAYTTGLRAGELFGLTWADACAEDGVPVLRITKALALRGDEGHATLRAPKTKASKRRQPLHPVAIRALAWWRSTGWRAWVGRDAKPGDLIWPAATGKGWRPRMADIFRADLEAAGLSTVFGEGDDAEPFEFRSTRRTFATLLEAAEVSPGHADKLMGHAPESVRSKYYATIALADLAASVARIDLDVADMFGQAPRALPTGGVSSEPIVGTDPSETIEATKDESKQESALVAQWIEQRFPKSKREHSPRENAANGDPEPDAKRGKTARTATADETTDETPAGPARADALEALLALAVSKGDLDTAKRALALLEERRRDAAGVVSLDAKRRGAK